MTNNRFNELFKDKPRKADELLTQKHMNIAASIQKVCEIIILKMTEALHNEYKIDQLCLAGGVALNCVANSKILNKKDFKRIWVQPASGDAGGSLGAALCGQYQFNKLPRIINKNDSMKGSLLGPAYQQEDIESYLLSIGAKFHTLSEEDLLERTSCDLQDGKIVGWFQGAMEFGPRALGNRSILGDPRAPEMQKRMNLKIKYRESFRPFAPAVLRPHLNEWFSMENDSPYMLFVADIIENKKRIMTPQEQKLFGIDQLNIQRSLVPAITHVDYSARVQTVNEKTNPLFFKLIKKFNEKTSCPMLINTSFNIRGEPIVCSPENAFQCFMGTELDILVIGKSYLLKTEQDDKLKNNYKVLINKD